MVAGTLIPSEIRYIFQYDFVFRRGNGPEKAAAPGRQVFLRPALPPPSAGGCPQSPYMTNLM